MNSFNLSIANKPFTISLNVYSHEAYMNMNVAKLSRGELML